MSDWTPVSSFIISSCKGITPSYTEKSSLMVINQRCIRDHKIDYSFCQFANNTLNLSDDKILRKGDILVNSTGVGTAGRCAFVSETPDNVTLTVDSHVLILRCKSFEEAKCLSYVLFSFEQTIMTFMAGSSGQAELDKVILLGLKTKMPKEGNRQKRINNVLSSLDLKINLNNKINAELESMARTIYNYWFVQFDFPCPREMAVAQGRPELERKPYKASGGKMVWNAELKKEIPEGWEIKPLSYFVDLVKTSIDPVTIQADLPYVGLEHIGRRTIVLSEWSTAECANSGKIMFTKNDVLFGKIRPYFHKVMVAPFSGITSTDTMIFRTKNIQDQGYILETVFSDSFVALASTSSTGSKMPRADWNILSNYLIPLGDNTTRDAFHAIYSSIRDKIFDNTENSTNFRDLRDFLLPLLMNGQVTVA